MIYRANVSSIQDFMQCRFRWVCKWVYNRVPVADAQALTQGKILHAIFEDHLSRGLTMAHAIVGRLAEAKATLAEMGLDAPGRYQLVKAIEGIEDLAEALAQWRDQYDWDIPILEVEEPFEIEHPLNPRFHLIGRPDRRGVMHGRQWHIQNRGLSAQTNFGVYMELATRHYHEHVYAEAGAIKYPQYPVGGTFMNLVRKLKYRTNKGKKNEVVKSLDQMFFQHPLAIDLNGPMHKDVMRCILQYMEEMEALEQRLQDASSFLPPPNEKMNGGFNGSTIDPYFRVLTGHANLWDNTLFKDREDTYSDVVVRDE